MSEQCDICGLSGNPQQKCDFCGETGCDLCVNSGMCNICWRSENERLSGRMPPEFHDITLPRPEAD